MSLLFDAPLIDGLAYRPDFISEEEEQALIRHLSELHLSPFRFHGWLEPLRDEAATLAGVAPGDIAHALIARYDPGAGIGWHKDRDVFEKVVGVSLGTLATLHFRRRAGSGFRRASIAVEPRSAYLLSGEARWEWEHRITPGDRLRFSITFRTLSDIGRRRGDRLIGRSARLEAGEALGDPARRG